MWKCKRNKGSFSSSRCFSPWRFITATETLATKTDSEQHSVLCHRRTALRRAPHLRSEMWSTTWGMISHFTIVDIKTRALTLKRTRDSLSSSYREWPQTRNTDLLLKFYAPRWKQLQRVFRVLQNKESQGKFKICWWVHQRGRHMEMGGAILKAYDAGDSPSSWTGGS